MISLMAWILGGFLVFPIYSECEDSFFEANCGEPTEFVADWIIPQEDKKQDPVKIAEAKMVLDKLSKNFRSLNSLKADFSLQIQNLDAGLSERQSGEIYIQSDKYHIKTETFERISNNESVWTHFIEEEEVQINEFDPDEGEFSPIQLFTMYENDYTYILNNKSKENGYNYATIDLIPIAEEDSPFSKVRLKINLNINMLEEALVFEKSGTVYTYTLGSFEKNIPLVDSYFEFDKTAHPNVDIIDLR